MVHQGTFPPPPEVPLLGTSLGMSLVPKQGDSREIPFLGISVIHTCEVATASLQMQVYFLLFRYSALIQSLLEPFKGLISEIMKKNAANSRDLTLYYFVFISLLTVLALDLNLRVCSF